jgi:hypothetical protein
MRERINSVIGLLRHRLTETIDDRHRSFRLAIPLASLFVFHAFDLALTQSQLERGNFAEANVLAAGAVASGAVGAAAYKVVLFGIGAYILYRFRQHRAAETGAWVLAVCGAGLMVWWGSYLDAIEICLQDPTVFIVPPPL